MCAFRHASLPLLLPACCICRQDAISGFVYPCPCIFVCLLPGTFDYSIPGISGIVCTLALTTPCIKCFQNLSVHTMAPCFNPAVQSQVQNPAASLQRKLQGQAVMLSFASVTSALGRIRHVHVTSIHIYT